MFSPLQSSQPYGFISRILWISCGLVDAIHWMDGYSVDFLWIGGCHPLDVWIFCGFSVDPLVDG